MTPLLVPRATAELVGTMLLVATVVGSGVMATELTDDVALQLLANSLATGAVLVALIVSLQPVSAAFNPVVTLVEVALRVVPARTAAVLVVAQVVGGALGAIIANLMFDLSAIDLSTHDRTGSGLWLGEVVATVGLVLVILGCVRAGRTRRGRVGGRRLDRGGVLVHVVDQLRQPGRHDRPHPVRHLRRDQPVVGADVRPDAARRRRRSPSALVRLLHPPTPVNTAQEALR